MIKGDVGLEQTHVAKFGSVVDRPSVPSGSPSSFPFYRNVNI